jgi:hypothetical protein
MEPPDDRLPWLEAAIEGLALQVETISAELRAAVATPQPLNGYERRLARKLRLQLEALREDCALIRDQLAHLRQQRGGRGGPGRP